MKNINCNGIIHNHRGFTLLELLIVVVIAAILVSIAMPHYQLARDKARYTQAMVMGEAIIQSVNRYIMKNDVAPTQLSQLDIILPVDPDTVPANKKKMQIKEDDRDGPSYIVRDSFSCQLHKSSYVQCKVLFPPKSGEYQYAWYFSYHGSPNRQCWVQKHPNERIDRLCQAVTGNKNGTVSGWYKKYDFLR